MRILIASDDDHASQHIRETLARNGVECSACDAVRLEAAANRASRAVPDLLVLVLSPDPAAGLAALRETCSTVPNMRVLAIGPATDAKLILGVLHEGADEFLDESTLEAELSRALPRLKPQENSATVSAAAGRVISVLAASGGSGSSTLAVNVSAALAQRYGECGLLDLRLASGDLAPMLDLKPTRTIADLCVHLARLDQNMFEQFFVRHPSGICLLAAPRQFADIQHVTSKEVRRAIGMARVRFPFVIADLDNVFDSEQVEALWQSDTILLVLRLDYTSVRNTRRMLDNLNLLRINADRIRLVANGYGERKQLGVKQAEEALGMRIVHYVPYDAASVNYALNKGLPVVVHRPKAKVSRSLRDLALALNGRPHSP